MLSKNFQHKSQHAKNTSIDIIPTDIQLHLLTFLDKKSLHSISATNRFFSSQTTVLLRIITLVDETLADCEYIINLIKEAKEELPVMSPQASLVLQAIYELLFLNEYKANKEHKSVEDHKSVGSDQIVALTHFLKIHELCETESFLEDNVWSEVCDVWYTTLLELLTLKIQLLSAEICQKQLKHYIEEHCNPLLADMFPGKYLSDFDLSRTKALRLLCEINDLTEKDKATPNGYIRLNDYDVHMNGVFVMLAYGNYPLTLEKMINCLKDNFSFYPYSCNSALHIAIDSNYPEIFKLTLPGASQLGSDYFKASLATAIRKGNPAFVSALLNLPQCMTSLNQSILFFSDHSEHFTPLIAAVFYGHLDIVKLLMQKNANPFITINLKGADVSAINVAKNKKLPEFVALLESYQKNWQQSLQALATNNHHFWHADAHASAKEEKKDTQHILKP